MYQNALMVQQYVQQQIAVAIMALLYFMMLLQAEI